MPFGEVKNVAKSKDSSMGGLVKAIALSFLSPAIALLAKRSPFTIPHPIALSFLSHAIALFFNRFNRDCPTINEIVLASLSCSSSSWVGEGALRSTLFC